MSDDQQGQNTDPYTNFSDSVYLKESGRTDLLDYTTMRQRLASSVAEDGLSGDDASKLLHAAMGISTEAGEFLDVLKKKLMYGKPIDRVNLLEELGDIQWYVALALRVLGADFTFIHEMNLKKLKHRFPGKFSEERAQTRDLSGERFLMENRVANMKSMNDAHEAGE